MFFDVPMEKVKIYVPYESIETYKSAPIWRDFGAILAIEDRPDRPTSITSKRKDKKHGIILENAVVSDVAKIEVKTPEKSQFNLIVFDNLGNVAFETSGKSSDTFTWDLKNKASRFVGNGTYLVVVEARGVSGRSYTYLNRLGIRR